MTSSSASSTASSSARELAGGRTGGAKLVRADRRSAYPSVALREALANAFCHRDYSIGGGSVGVAIHQDRLEITSSGTLHFGLTAEKLFEPHESLPWNPLIAHVFYRRGIIETWGAAR
jgi:ATP-dependent DNA helicase RecG